MRLARVQFKLLHLMIAVAVIAGVLVLLETSWGFMVLCGLWSVVLATIFWAHLRHQRTRAFRAFGIASMAVNCSFAWLSVYALNLWGMAGMFLGMLCGMPMILGFGTAWAAAATRRDSVRRRSPFLAWPLVIVLVTLPTTMLFTHWPLRLAFFASRPALDRLADRAAAGQILPYPTRAGLFVVIGWEVDWSTGNVGLIIDPDASGRTGFVRLGPGSKISGPGHIGPLFNLAADWEMVAGWQYQTED